MLGSCSKSRSNRRPTVGGSLEVPELPGVITYGASREEAVTRAQALSLRVLAERLEHGEDLPPIRPKGARLLPGT